MTSSRPVKAAFKLWSLLPLTAVGGVLSLFAISPASAEVVLRFTTFEPEGIVGYQARKLGDAISQSTDGEVTLEYYWAGSLLPAAQMASGIADGIADIGMTLPPYNPSEFPIANWATVLGSLAETEFPLNMLQAAGANAETILSSEALRAEFDRQGLVMLTPIFSYPGFDLLCKEPVTNLQTAEGKRVRVGGNLWATEAQKVGMEPVALPGSDVYQAAQRGIVDCVMQHPPGYVGNSVWEVVKHFTPTQFTGWNAAYLVIGKAKWNSLDEAQQKAIREGAFAYFVATHEKSLQDYAEFAGSGADEHGIEFHTMEEDLAAAVAEAQATGRADAIGTAPGSLEDPEGFVTAYEEAMAKWKAIVFDNGLVDLGGAESGSIREKMAAAANLDLSRWADRAHKEVFSKYSD